MVKPMPYTAPPLSGLEATRASAERCPHGADRLADGWTRR
jgi:hypothetical protein